MKGYELSPEATDDLQEIWVYIANDNPIAADKLEDDIYAACELLAKNSRFGHRRGVKRNLADVVALLASVDTRWVTQLML